VLGDAHKRVERINVIGAESLNTGEVADVPQLERPFRVRCDDLRSPRHNGDATQRAVVSMQRQDKFLDVWVPHLKITTHGGEGRHVHALQQPNSKRTNAS